MRSATRGTRRSTSVPPPFTRIPIALWSASLLLDVASPWFGNELVRASFLALSGACAFAIFAAMSGAVRYNRIPFGHPAQRLGLLHGAISAGVLAMFCVNAWWRGMWLDAPRTPLGPVLLSALALAWLAVASWLGGRLAELLGATTAVAPALREPAAPTPLRPREPVGP